MHFESSTLSTRRWGTVAERLWAKVDRTAECWIWTGACDQDGYGRLSINNRRQRVHRISWVLHYGALPPDMGVLHHCDNPPCVRPDHLFLGDAIANNADKVRKGRQSRGDQHDSRTRPECLARGDRNGRRLHPERYAHVKSSGVRGEAHGMARLTTEQVRAIRAKYQPRRVTIAQLAQEFGVSTHTIQAILSRRLWAHVA